MSCKMKQITKKSMALILSIALFLSGVPVNTLAAEEMVIGVNDVIAREQQYTVIYSLAEDAGVQDLEIGATGSGALLNDTAHLQGSGGPVLTIVEHPESGNSISVSGRDADWHTIDFVQGNLDLEARNVYQLQVIGRVPVGRGGLQAQIAQTVGPWSVFASAVPNANGEFVLNLPLDAAMQTELAANRLRLRTNGVDDFIIDDIFLVAPVADEVYIPGPGVATLLPETITLQPNRVRGFEIQGFGVERSELSWELSGNVSANTTITNGFLSIADDNPLGTIVVRAFVTANPEIYGVATVTVGGASTSLIHNLPAGLNFDAYPSLREVYADYFLMGVAGDTAQINNTPLGQLRSRLVGHHYNSWSFENSMKVQPLRGNTAANRLQPVSAWPGLAGPTNTMNAARAAYAGMSFAGHTTAWHSQSPEWMWDRHPGGTANRQIGLENLHHHVRGTFEQFGAQISSMDVVNEAIGSVSPTDPGNWRNSLARGEGWYPTLGAYWVMYAFIFAAEIVDELDQDVTLYYNDFLLHTGNKGYSVYRMVREINEMHANGEVIHPMTGEVFQRPNGQLLIEGIGMQDRQSGILDIEGFSDAINMFATLGVKVAITEMDLSWRVTSPDGLLTAEEEIAQGQQMARFFEMVRRYASGPATAGSPYPRVVERVTFWGVDDVHSWSPGEPMLFGRPDVANNIIPGKEALRAVIDPFRFMEDHPWVPEELPPVPGVNIFDLAEDGFTGANIILGTDATVWPFASGDEVAYTPTPGATYRLLVRYQTFGTYGLEAHWITDNSASNFTTANNAAALIMPTITRGSGAGPTATGIPARFFNPGVGGSFAWLETTFTMPADVNPGDLIGNIALRGINGGNEFGFYSIEITRLNPEGDDTLLVNWPFLPPLIRPEIPGIIVPTPNDAQSNGRADIIIGSGRDVWPFADAHESGVAFEPVPGTTYRIMFNIRTTGAGGWRVRWIPGTGGEDYTTGDGAIVNAYPLRVSSFGLGVPTPDLISAMPVASVIPSHQNSGVSPAGVYTIIQDITLTGDEVYQGLIGNIALRGTGGSGSFVVNWISIEELTGGPGTDAAQTLNFWPFGVDSFEAFSDNPIAYVEASDGFANNHFEPNVLNVANNTLAAITRLGETPVINAANPPMVGETLVAGRITGGAGTGSGLRTGITQGFLAGTAIHEWLIDGEVVHTGETFTVPANAAGEQVQVRLTSDFETGELVSGLTPGIIGAPDAPAVEIVQDDMNLALGATYQLTYLVTPAGTEIQDLNWTTSDDSVVTVTPEGVVLGVGVGEAVVSLESAAKDLADEITITVYDPALVDARATLVALLASIDLLDEANYTDSSWAALLFGTTLAEIALDLDDLALILAAIDVLGAAIQALIPVDADDDGDEIYPVEPSPEFVAAVEGLIALVIQMNLVVQGDYSDASWAQFIAAREVAVALLAAIESESIVANETTLQLIFAVKTALTVAFEGLAEDAVDEDNDNGDAGDGDVGDENGDDESETPGTPPGTPGTPGTPPGTPGGPGIGGPGAPWRPDAPSTPSGPAMIAPSDIEFDAETGILSWNAVTGATGYRIYVNPRIEVTVTSFDVTTLDLDAGVYTVRIRSLFANGHSPLSEAVVFTITDEGTMTLGTTVVEDLADDGNETEDAPATEDDAVENVATDRPALPQTGVLVTNVTTGQTLIHGGFALAIAVAGINVGVKVKKTKS